MKGPEDNICKLSTLILAGTYFENIGELKRYSLSMKITFVIILFIHGTSANVQWKIKESMIVLGKPVNLECTTSTTNNRKVSRRWTGGVQNRLLCFNGVATYPDKYEETEVSNDTYTLQIKETTEDDLDCPYSCRFGFQSDEKILYVTEHNFKYIPNENETKVEYNIKEDNYTLHLEFKKVFPEPVCWIQLQNTLYSLVKIKQTKGRIFYHVLYQLESMNPLHACGSDLEINCTFGSELRILPFQHNVSCTDTLSLDETKSSKSSIGITVVLIVILAAIFTVIAVIYSIYSVCNKNRAKLNGKRYKPTKTNEPHYMCDQQTISNLYFSCQTASDPGAVGRLHTNKRPI